MNNIIYSENNKYKLIKIDAEKERLEYSCLIYIIKHNIDTKVYIGQTWQNLQRRWRDGNGYVSCRSFYEVINKYNGQGFHYEILGMALTQKDADYWEIYFIDLYKANNVEYGYNILDGGSKRQAPNKYDTPEDLEQNKKISNLYVAGASLKEVAKTLDISAKRVRKGLKDSNVSIRERGSNKKYKDLITDEIKQKVINLYTQNKSYPEIAKIIDITYSGVKKIMRELKNDGFKPRKAGGKRKNLPEEQKQVEKQMIDMYIAGKSSVDIGNDLGWSSTYVQQVLRKNGVKLRNTGTMSIKLPA